MIVALGYLKSNMDRFIGLKSNNEHHKNSNLKSNMDRFIVSVSTETAAEYFNLKSNMDRFIGNRKYTFRQRGYEI